MSDETPDRPEKPVLSEIIKKRFADDDRPATMAMIADIYAKMSIISDALVALTIYSGTFGEAKKAKFQPVLDAISRLSEDLSQSVLKLNEDQKRSPDGK